jgi:CheY-like chemotaxis protein
VATQNTDHSRTRRSANGNGQKKGEPSTRSAPAGAPARRAAGRLTHDDETERLEELVRALRAFAAGDFSIRVPGDGRGPLAEIARAYNDAVARADTLGHEFERLAAVVGREGKMNERASMPAARGAWSDYVVSVNSIMDDLVRPSTEVARVITAVAGGDLSQKMALEIDGKPVRGEFYRIGTTVNTMVDQLRSFAAEVTRVAREVGTEGKLGGQANVPGVAGTWKDLTDSVNSMASNLTTQVRGIVRVVTAVANGDLNQKFVLEAKGELAALAETINSMTDTLRVFADQVTTVAREVGTEGKLGGQARVPGVAGTWKDLTDSVNSMARNLTDQVRNIALVTTAVANGDLSQKITVDVRGETLELKNTINTMVDQLRGFAAEVTRVAREVGTEGKLGGQARVPDIAGTWKGLTDNVNSMASNLTDQIRNIALVTTAVANGDLSRKITVEVKGELLELKNTINTMVDQLRGFAAEVTRVAREVGTEGKLGGQARVPGVGGTWKDLTDSVNSMASNLTDQVRNIALVTTAVANGDLGQKITVEVKGELLELKNTINTMVDQLRSFAAEVTRVAREVGTQGKLGGQAFVPGVGGTWKDLTDNVNSMASNLTTQVRGIVKVVTAVANGDLSKRLVLDAKGEIAELAETINDMTETLGIFAEQVTTVAREVGTEGKLGGQARVPGVAGTWKDLTDSVNSMASNLTTQVRGIVRVVTAVANGDLSQKLVLDAKGEIAALVDTINSMTDTLRVFADQVTTVAREVGTEGKLGGQARVPGAAGIWRDLTDNVNQLADNLTVQMRAIADVATAVTKGDLTRSVTVRAQGELLTLKDNVNQMIANLRETTDKSKEQDWLKSNLAKLARLMQGQKTLESISALIMSELTPLVGAHHGAFFLSERENGGTVLKLTASYAYKVRKSLSNHFKLGEGLVGQSALEKKSILLTNVPDDYVAINSGLGEAPPRNVIVMPVLFEGEVRAVIELASFHQFSAIHLLFLDQLAESIGVVLNMIAANMRTEELLLQSTSLADELRNQQRELQQQQQELRRSNSELEAQARSLRESEELLRDQGEELQQINEELEEKAALLAEQNAKVEQKNREVELAKKEVEAQAERVALIAKYKGEFLANMSHELRTPLNSLLILARLLSENKEANLNPRQVEYAQTIYSAGSDLLNLINEVLDLSKVEAGKMEIAPSDVLVADLDAYLERHLRHVAQQRGLEFSIKTAEGVPASIYTDALRLQQILRNLLSNAFKFTDRGRVEVRIERPAPGVIFENPALAQAGSVVAFAVRDTGIGIPADKQRLIFEAFQQADGTTSRKFGGTGLGLAISRELAKLLGGEIQVQSKVGEGSTFTLLLPERHDAPPGSPGSPEPAARPALPPAAAAPFRPADLPAAPDPHDDDRRSIVPGDRVVLVVEDDEEFGRVLLDMARSRDFKAVVLPRAEHVPQFLQRYRPDAVVLDVDLPDREGWKLLERLKANLLTKAIPVHVVSASNRRQEGLRMGAVTFLEKPVGVGELAEAFGNIKAFLDENMQKLLVAEDDQAQREAILALFESAGLAASGVGTAEEALAELSARRYDALVVDLGLPDMTGFDLLERARALPNLAQLPIIVYTGRELTPAEETRLRKNTDSIIVKGARSPERLLDEAALFLHRVATELPEHRRPQPSRVDGDASVFQGKKVLVVDDDVRNIFALTSVLEGQGMSVSFAENGREGLEALKQQPDVDLVLMDIMMPEMDGYETIAALRKLPQFQKLPVIALTAKAMRGDREKCIAAGASDYITKPVDMERLLSLMRVWLYR